MISYLLIYLLGINLMAFLLIKYDKSLAINQSWRIPEKTLHLFSLLGGFVGSSLAIKLYRHKTRKFEFLIIHYMIVISWVVPTTVYILKKYSS